ncbi:unnamed protein product [Discula destructiva]
MRSSIIVSALFGAVAHAQWEVRADFSRCDTTGLEAALDGATATVAGVGIYDFVDITVPFSGSLVIKPAGSIGYGSPYPVDKVDIDIFASADANGAFANATFVPAMEVLPTALVAWYTIPGLNAFSTAKIEVDALAGDVPVSVATTVDESRLRVYYCYAPTSA